MHARFLGCLPSLQSCGSCGSLSDRMAQTDAPGYDALHMAEPAMSHAVALQALSAKSWIKFS